MSFAAAHIAMMAVQNLPLQGGVVPSEIHILPAGPSLQTGDGRGPYSMGDASAVIAASFAERDRIEIDVNHSTFLAAPKGGDAPAVGWITAMQSRADGIWGTVEWTEHGRALVASRAYRGISPVLSHEAQSKRVTAILNASLVNRPNMKGLTTLHMEEAGMLPWLIELLGLSSDATEEDVRKAVGVLVEGAADKPEGEMAKMAEMEAAKRTMNAQVLELGAALGLPKDASLNAMVEKVKASSDVEAAPAEVVALQAEVATLTTSLNTMIETRSRDAAEAFVDGAIKAGRAGVRPSRDRFITMHMADAKVAEEVINGMPILNASGTSVLPPEAKDGEITLNAEQRGIAKMLGVSPETYLAQVKADAAKKEGV